MTRDEAFGFLRGVRDELAAARFALSEVLRDSAAGADVATDAPVALGVFQACLTNLEVTYLLRLFGEFEAVLRDYWERARRRSTQPAMEVLMGSIAAYLQMSDSDAGNAQVVREYRNTIVHHRLREARLTFPECAKRLGKYLRWFPVRW